MEGRLGKGKEPISFVLADRIKCQLYRVEPKKVLSKAYIQVDEKVALCKSVVRDLMVPPRMPVKHRTFDVNFAKFSEDAVNSSTE